MRKRPKPGQVWEYAGKRRRVDEVRSHGDNYELRWNDRKQWTWCSTWEAWQAKAVLVAGEQ